MAPEQHYEFEVKDKGRAVLPAGLRSVCGFEPGTRLTARPMGPGQALVETRQAVLARIWSHRPEGRTDGVGALRRWRAEQARHEHTVTHSADVNATGAATLAALGLS